MSEIAGEIILDTSLLEPPEPFIEAMEILRQIQPGQFLHMIHRREPCLLYPELLPLELTSYTHKETPQLFHVLIWSPKDPVATVRSQELIQQLTSNL